VTRLTTDLATDAAPNWSPDGTKIAFETNRDGNFEVYVMNLDGTGLVDLSNNAASDRQPAWSPDGTRIAFQSNRDGNFEIYSMNPEGTDQTRLTNSPGADVNPDWGPRFVEYPRPKGATPLRVSFVPAYQQCTAPNRTHGAPLRLTDRADGTPTGEPSTTVDFPFTVNASCSDRSPFAGANCGVTTTANSLNPGMVPDGRRSVWQIDQIQVYDAGADGNGATSGDETRDAGRLRALT